jgi:hypothetical protein
MKTIEQLSVDEPALFQSIQTQWATRDQEWQNSRDREQEREREREKGKGKGKDKGKGKGKPSHNQDIRYQQKSNWWEGTWEQKAHGKGGAQSSKGPDPAGKGHQDTNMQWEEDDDDDEDNPWSTLIGPEEAAAAAATTQQQRHRQQQPPQAHQQQQQQQQQAWTGHQATANRWNASGPSWMPPGWASKGNTK